MNYKEKYNYWLKNDYFDEKTKVELRKISDNEAEIKDRFNKNLDFGTGGLRGIIGAGTNRINKYTIRKASQGLANYILEFDKIKNKSVVISYDSRYKSKSFAKEAAMVLTANEIKVYLFDKLRPTPELSFSVRELSAIAGIMITASHNPAEYNGYKVYWKDGAQIVSPHDKEIIKKVNEINNFNDIKIIKMKEARQKKLLKLIGEEIDNKYIRKIKNLSLNSNVVKKNSDNLSLVYTPLHGSGGMLIKRILKEIGLKNIFLVKEQEKPNPKFPTLDYPNPENPAAFDLGIKVANRNESDLVIATDPDADRIGVAVKHNNEWEFLSGNQLGILLAGYIIESIDNIPKNSYMIKTIVSTRMINRLAKKNKFKVINTLTGFKYIGEKIQKIESKKTENNFLFGFEESCGYLYGTHVRDKDAVITTMLVVEMAAYYKQNGISIYQKLINLYKEYGYYKSDLVSLKVSEKENPNKIKNLFFWLRNNNLEEINGRKIVIKKDFLSSKKYNLLNNTKINIDLPKSNVIQFLLEDNSLITIRPSGTEPKIKFYFSVNDESHEGAEYKLKSLKKDLFEILKEYKKINL